MLQSPAGECQLIAAELRVRYEALVAGGAEGEAPQSEGRMLLLGFNGLFAALEAAGPAWAAVERLAARTPTAWRKIDQINLAMHMSAAMQSESVRAIVDSVLWVRRVQAVAEVLAQCAQHAAAFRGVASFAALSPSDHAALCKPVRRFTAELVSRRLLGVPSRALGSVLCLLLRRARLDVSAEVEQKEIGASWTVPLESLYEKAREMNGCSAVQLERAGALYAAAERARRAHHQRTALGRRLDVARAHAHCARVRLAAHSQLHADLLGNSGNIGPAMARHARELVTAQERLATAQAKAQALLTQAHQRVKWGAGANPALTSVVVALESSWAACNSRADALTGVASQLAAHARAAAHQRTRTSKLARTARQALAHWEKACTLALKYSLEVSPIEESLMEMLHPEGNIDAQWVLFLMYQNFNELVENVSALIREMITQLSAEASAGSARRASAAERVRSAGDGLAQPLSERARLSAELRAPLDVLKHAYEGNNLAFELLTGEREVAELGRAAAAGTSAAADGDSAVVRGALRALTCLAELLPKLQKILHDNVENKWWCESGSRRLTRQSAITAQPRAAPPRHGGERNAQGAGVWKRVRLKLEGRDPDPARRATPHEQVPHVLSRIIYYVLQIY
ncbi:hypothetical protein EVAR_59630_1 [Eumeta japonica]|uniref:Uncharacterized protein n=1 Tax=Eumeta variegata TaxID=151549 RepID=A0A4C1YK75_EUMVA|nr:hypothetical protein EVAR_59630_1 [Eumeta japonica]